MSAPLQVRINWLDRALAAVSPSWAVSRIRARTHFSALARNFEAAQVGRRTAGWSRSSGDANAANGPALALLRFHARDLLRNNSWATNARRVVLRNVVGWGLAPKATDVDEFLVKEIAGIWRRWAGTTVCDADGLLTFAGLQRQVLSTVMESGEALIRRRWRRMRDGLELPMQLQVLEPDFLDTTKDGLPGQQGGKIVQGVEFDAIGRRVAYWLFDEHPGSRYVAGVTSRRVDATEIIHVFDVLRAGQVRGVSWFAPAIVNLKDFDEYEDATIMRQKIAALFAAFVTDPNGSSDTLGQVDPADDQVEGMEPGMVKYLAPGETVEFASPPLVGNDGFSERTLRRVAAGIGVTYEDLTGDYSQVNFSSARMGRLAHWGNVYDWQWNMIVPRLCDPVWAWAMEAAAAVGLVDELPAAEWTAPPMPMIDPDKEGLAYIRRVRSGAMTFSEMIREQGRDPDAHLAEYAEDQKKLDALGIWLDSDVRRVSAAGLTQERVGGGADGSKPSSTEKP